MEGWVDLGYLAMRRLGVEFVISRSHVRCRHVSCDANCYGSMFFMALCCYLFVCTVLVVQVGHVCMLISVYWHCVIVCVGECAVCRETALQKCRCGRYSELRPCGDSIWSCTEVSNSLVWLSGYVVGHSMLRMLSTEMSMPLHTFIHTKIWGDWKCKYGKGKYRGMEYASTENLSTNWQGWKTQEWKTQVQICRGGKRKYGNGKSNLNADVTENITANLRNRYWAGIIHSKAVKLIVLSANSNLVQVWLFLGTFLYIVILIGCNIHIYLKEVDINMLYRKQCFSKYCIRNNKKYEKCDTCMCNATGYFEGDILGTILYALTSSKINWFSLIAPLVSGVAGLSASSSSKADTLNIDVGPNTCRTWQLL